VHTSESAASSCMKHACYLPLQLLQGRTPLNSSVPEALHVQPC
jgi:hypothetical protein